MKIHKRLFLAMGLGVALYASIQAHYVLGYPEKDYEKEIKKEEAVKRSRDLENRRYLGFN